jgi:hypothetical protein
MPKELLVATVEHQLFYDTETKRYRSAIKLMPGTLDHPGSVLRMAVLTASLKRHLDQANQTIDDLTELNEIEKEENTDDDTNG